MIEQLEAEIRDIATKAKQLGITTVWVMHDQNPLDGVTDIIGGFMGSTYTAIGLLRAYEGQLSK